jgi:hypothetical protein
VTGDTDADKVTPTPTSGRNPAVKTIAIGDLTAAALPERGEAGGFPSRPTLLT